MGIKTIPEKAIYDSYDDIKLDLLIHFAEEEECGWSIMVNSDEEAHLIVAEMPYLELYEDEDRMMVKKIRDLTIEENACYYHYMFIIYKNDYDKMYDKIAKLCDEL